MEGQRSCAACGAGGPFALVFRRGPWTLARCPVCGLVFQEPQPSLDSMPGLYYFDPAFARRLEGELAPVARARAAEKLPLLCRAGVKAGGPALDVGCSSGEWLEVARDAGWQPQGVEVGATADVARRRGFEVHTGTLESATHLAGDRFALITLWDVLEHLHDPLDALRRVARLLRPGGLVAMTFPNVEGWYPRLTYQLLARPFGVWEHPELPVHLFDLSPATAGRLVRRAGLAVQYVTTMPMPFEAIRPRLTGELGRRGRALRPAFEVLRLLVYPPARVFDRGNAMFLLARRPG